MILAAKRLSQSTTGDLGERCKDPQRVLGRAPAYNTFWVGASDPILSQLRVCGDLRTPNRKHLWTLYMQFYLCFSALLKLTINNDRKI